MLFCVDFCCFVADGHSEEFPYLLIVIDLNVINETRIVNFEQSPIHLYRPVDVLVVSW